MSWLSITSDTLFAILNLAILMGCNLSSQRPLLRTEFAWSLLGENRANGPKNTDSGLEYGNLKIRMSKSKKALTLESTNRRIFTSKLNWSYLSKYGLTYYITWIARSVKMAGYNTLITYTQKRASI